MRCRFIRLLALFAFAACTLAHPCAMAENPAARPAVNSFKDKYSDVPPADLKFFPLGSENTAATTGVCMIQESPTQGGKHQFKAKRVGAVERQLYYPLYCETQGGRWAYDAKRETVWLDVGFKPVPSAPLRKRMIQIDMDYGFVLTSHDSPVPGGVLDVDQLIESRESNHVFGDHLDLAAYRVGIEKIKSLMEANKPITVSIYSFADSFDDKLGLHINSRGCEVDDFKLDGEDRGALAALNWYADHGTYAVNSKHSHNVFDEARPH